MMIEGKKWACAACVKGHRAPKCKHHDRPLVEIKKKGRPVTQCERCRMLRSVRQLHTKCDCNAMEASTGGAKGTINTGVEKACTELGMKGSLRPIAPKPNQPNTCHNDTDRNRSASALSSCHQATLGVSDLWGHPPKEPPAPPSTYLTQGTSSTDDTCCVSRQPDGSCCSSKEVNQQGQPIRVVNCRCGDSCACVACDAHPSRAMKNQEDPYAGFPVSERHSRHRLSIAALCTQPEDEPSKLSVSEGLKQQQQQQPTSILNSEGVALCGCGCALFFEDCFDCFRELCACENASVRALRYSH